MNDLRTIEEIQKDIDDVEFFLEEDAEFGSYEYDKAMEEFDKLQEELEFTSWYKLQFA